MIVILLPNEGFDPTESAVPWQMVTDAGYTIKFATPDGNIAQADKRMLNLGFGLLSPLLMTRASVLKMYRRMIEDSAFQKPLTYKDIIPEQVSGIIVPGGHGPGMKVLLESKILQATIVDCFKQNKCIGAICTGVVLLARSIDPSTGKSVLYGRKTTAITKFMELAGWGLTYFWLKDYFRIYSCTAQDEISKNLKNKQDFLTGSFPLIPFFHKNLVYLQFIVKDKNYLSARWPGDCFRFSEEYIELLKLMEN